ncbi:MAG: Nif3-like dinuclear metal center hexameric protein [Oscillospiraceae bacterium]|nr:Nif3-like dinuclear metal center hexameric protein [Oscillospiraceae bacterium]
MKANDIINIIEKVCPENLAYPWDNVGLLCGDSEKEVNKVFVTLDTNIKTVKEAIEKKADMIVSHHPVLLGGIKRIDYTTSQGQMIKLLIENNIPLFAAHTNMDTAKGGINDRLAIMFNLTDIEILEQHTCDTTAGLGRIGKLKNTVKFDEFTKKCKEVLNTTIRAAGDFNTDIKTVAVASGSCSEIIPLAKEKGADVIITGDMKYHNMIDMTELGICVIDAGHYPTEICVMDIFEDILKDCDIEIIKSENKDIFNFI